jgi:copper(I)-binding protein
MRQFAASQFVSRLHIVSASRKESAAQYAALIPFRFSMEKDMRLNVLMLAAIGALAAQSAWAANVSVTNAWARATVPGQQVSGAYMQIQSDADARLVGASSTAVPRVEVHEMKMDGDVMRMRQVQSVDLPKGKTVSLEPGGFHIMLMNLPKPIAAGDVIPLTLVVESGGKRQTVEVKAEVRAAGSTMQHGHQ